MDIQAEKLRLIELLLKVTDQDILSKIKSILKPDNTPNLFLNAEEEERILAALEESENDIKNGNVYSHQQVKEFLESKFNRKFGNRMDQKGS